MEETIIIYAITISWIYLAYSVGKPALKELLHLIIAGNLISLVYFMYGITGTLDFIIYKEASSLYLLFNVMAFISFLIFYLYEWTTKYIKKKKKEDIGFF